MTERLIYKLYKITNSVNDQIYVGSTRLNPLRKRMDCHRAEARKNNSKKLSQFMREIGIEKFNIELIREIYVPNSKIARIQEQIEIWKIPVEQRLNTIRASIPNLNYRNNEKKRANRRAYYHRKKNDPEWLERERARNRERMRRKRQLARDRLTD